MKTHIFTPQERRVIEAAFGRLQLTLEVIAQCRGVHDPIVLLDDRSGFAVVEHPVRPSGAPATIPQDQLAR